MLKKQIAAVMVAGLLLVAGACTSSREREVEQEFSQYKSWVNEKADKAGNTLEDEWKEVKREYDQKTAQLEGKSEDLSDASKEEYRQLKARFNEVDSRYQKELEMRRQEEAMMNDEQKAKDWEQTTFGTALDVTTVNAENLRDAYISFMETVRRNGDSWSEEEWRYADRTYARLNARRDELDNTISSKDKLKIIGLQTEFKSLQAASAAKDTYKDVKKDVKD